MVKNNYTFKTAKSSDPLDTSWRDAQNWCNFVLFQPTGLPEGLSEKSNKIRPESPDGEASHRVEFHDTKRSLSIKQFLYDWAPPAYDHPCLWRNAKISKPENIPVPKPYLIGNSYLWFGLDYRRKPAATINMLRTQVEITTLHGEFEDQEIVKIVRGLVSVDTEAKDLILNTSFAELMFNARHQVPVSDVPTSYFKHTRSKAFQCYPHAIISGVTLPADLMMDATIENYRLDSLFLFGSDPQHIQEVEYYYENVDEPGAYIRFIVTLRGAKNSIKYPPQLGDQECQYLVHKLENDENLYHACSKLNQHGSHSLVFKVKDTVINCIIKPAPWTTVNWGKDVCAKVLLSSPESAK